MYTIASRLSSIKHAIYSPPRLGSKINIPSVRYIARLIINIKVYASLNLESILVFS